ncbi:DNA/RNA nuclease SfsA [Herbinix luporum]|jgi:sugar fermentation stimulation protein A|uniref:Sugar fermentation stimulation protein homolog n=1 Tax=Herbinix luporum TaxID=1679721 RepID=A0A0K8J888_9FIRM|nr:DNA/RNA nuclease SfsA [Herbinix luporum]CUH93800.1 Sugar fermentation stimulation protein homolog [Herbinix luporum]HHT57574.1 DNA/RNA nuclease SfsA [Herbinix luporum]
MIFNYDIRFGSFIKRPNRFIAHIDLDGQEIISHVPNTGRMHELLIPGTCVLLSYHPSEKRKTKYELRMVKKNDKWFSIDSQLPNALAYEAISKGVIEELKGYTEIKREVKYQNSRFDLQLSGDNQLCFVEVKGVTLEKEGWSYFPDAPTERGRKHIDELIHAVRSGYRAVLLFIVQFEQAKGFSPNKVTDPAFAAKLKEAIEAGVEVLSYGCMITPEEIKVVDKIPIIV